MKRPSHREISARLLSAKAATSKGAVRLINAKSMREDLLDLDFLLDDLPELLPAILDELNTDHYRGTRPPQKSYEDAIKGCELYAFSWESPTLRCAVYFKFTLQGESLWIVSFHRDRKSEGGVQNELHQ